MSENEKIISMEEVRKLLANGETPESIAIKYGMDVEKITRESVMNKIIDAKTTLEKQLAVSNSLAEIAEFEYRNDPIDRKAYAVTAFMQNSQAILTQLEHLKNNDEKVTQVVEKVIQPLIRNTMRYLGEGISTVLEQAHDMQLRKHLNYITENLGKELTTEYKMSINRLGEIFDCDFNTGELIGNKTEENDNESISAQG